MRLLIVEDEPGTALAIEDVASDAGFEITGIAGNMSEALELGSEADIAIIDVRLGDGITGPFHCSRPLFRIRTWGGVFHREPRSDREPGGPSCLHETGESRKNSGRVVHGGQERIASRAGPPSTERLRRRSEPAAPNTDGDKAPSVDDGNHGNSGFLRSAKERGTRCFCRDLTLNGVETCSLPP